MDEVFGVVYFLADPRSPEVPRYFGKTTRGLVGRYSRFDTHVAAAKRGVQSHVARWISVLLRAGLLPVIREVSTARTEEELNAQERASIAAGRACGLPLCNISAGGEGKSGWVTPEETREKMRQAALGRKHTPETIAKMRGRSFSEEHRRKLGVAHLGEKWSAERIEKRRRSQLGSKREGVALENIRAAISRPDVRARTAEAKVLAWTDPGIRARRIAGMTLAQNRPDVKVRKSSAIEKSWADPEVRARRTAALQAAADRRRMAGVTGTRSDEDRARRAASARDRRAARKAQLLLKEAA